MFVFNILGIIFLTILSSIVLFIISNYMIKYIFKKIYDKSYSSVIDLDSFTYFGKFVTIQKISYSFGVNELFKTESDFIKAFFSATNIFPKNRFEINSRYNDRVLDKLYLIEQLINCPSKKQKKLNEKYDRFIFKIENNPNQFYTLNLIDRLNEVYYFEILSKIMMSCKYLFNKIVFEGITTYNNYDPNCFSKMNFNGDETTLKYNKLYFFRRNNIIFTRNKTLLNYDIKEESFTLREVAREVCGNDTNNRVFIWPEELTLFNNIKWIFKDYEEIFKLMSEYNFDINFDNELPQNIFIKEYYNDAIYNVWKLIK